MIIILENKIYFALEIIPTKNEFYKYFGVKEETYMANFIDRVYNYIFYGCVDLYEDYTKYYLSEYKEFTDYLEKYHYLKKNMIKDIIEGTKKIYYTNLDFKEDYGVSEFFKDHYDTNDMQDVIRKFFEEK